MSLRKIPESEKTMWRQLVQNARGRADLKQPAGFLTLVTLLIIGLRGTLISDALVYTLGAVVVIWYIGDAKEAENVLKALYGGFRHAPATEINSESTSVDSQQTTVSGPTVPVEEPAA